MESASLFSRFPYIPSHLPNEVLYAWISRLHILNSYRGSKNTLRDLFGSSLVMPSVDLPSNLQRFLENTNGWGPFKSLEEITEKMTLFPYFSRFVSRERRQDILSRMGSCTNGPKASMGLLANGFGASVLLRRCNLCDEEYLRLYGCRTWLSFHQLPFITVCPVHGVPLVSYFIQSQLANKNCLLVKETSSTLMPERMSQPMAARFSALSQQALYSTAPALSNEKRAQCYVAAIAGLNMACKNRINWDKLVNFVGQSYNWFSGMACQGRLLSSSTQPMRWLHDLCHRPDRNQHPVCHLLLVGCLFKDVDSFFRMAIDLRSSTSFASNPSYGEYTLRSAKNDELQLLIRNQNLSCREVARLSGKSVTSIVLRRKVEGLAVSVRPKNVTEDLIVQIGKLAAAGESAKNISILTNASLSTVYRALLICNTSIQTIGARRQHYRKVWSALISADSLVGKAAVRAQSPATFAWLYRNDREWLNENSPTRTRYAKSCQPRVNWNERDVYYAKLINAVAAKRSLFGDEKKITVTSLLRATRHEAMIRSNILKMPEVQRALSAWIEDDQTFSRRRRLHALHTIESQGAKDIQEWQIQKKSKIRPRRS